VSIAAQIKEEMELTLFFIAHDLHMVRFLSERVAVMYKGRILEEGMCEDVFMSPVHPYTRALIESMPTIDPTKRSFDSSLFRFEVRGKGLEGGCPYVSRCPHASRVCKDSEPPFKEIEKDHRVACHLSN
jgi:oligopeptide/dipeptide ABC transporter ATP-binding protein